MNVLVFGDIHGLVGKADIPTIDIVVEIVKKTKADLVLQLGDMGGYRPFCKPVYWIFGNNDSISTMNAFINGQQPVENLIHNRIGEVLSFCQGEERITLSGLNGAYDPLYFEFNRSNLKDFGYFTEEEAEQCLSLSDIDIFLAHGCPSGLGFGREPDYGNPSIRKILDTVKPRYMFCGHGHFYREAAYNGCKIYSLDEAKNAYYMLDTKSGTLRAMETNSAEFNM